jgi:hypothetical protein
MLATKKKTKPIGGGYVQEQSHHSHRLCGARRTARWRMRMIPQGSPALPAAKTNRLARKLTLQ